ncbi:UDP-N-acetylmuramate dehydrogenase [Castellaniella sp. GW247-6E4]|uniref:UDP-N-acetylmuramate dehydrogenase n=1 Tax=Castellaniella sp. GW247-6E4 TaxID=3140380 RepID=UPI0033161068
MTEQDLQGFNTLGLPARARALYVEGEADARILSTLADAGHEVFVLGGGSNVVMCERPRHLVARVGLRGIGLRREDREAWVIEAAAGEPWHDFVAYCLSQGWPGLENLALIPGTVGAAPVQNIGAYGLELDQRLEGVVAWDIQAARRVELAPEGCGFAYRDSLFKRAGAGRWLILAVRFRLPKVWHPVLDYPDLRTHPALAGGEATPGAVFDAVCDIRRRKLPDPALLGNAGSFFKNPVVPAVRAEALRERFPGLPAYGQPDGRVKLAAGWLIEQAGWKGRRLGPVGMHERQALVLVNHGGAAAADVLRLARAVCEDVRARFGVELEREPVLLD